MSEGMSEQRLDDDTAAPPSGGEGAPLLRVDGLHVDYQLPQGTFHALRDINLQLDRHDIFGIVGESGSGKSTLSSAILRLLPPNGRITGGRVMFEGEDLVAHDAQGLRAVRGAGIGMVFQDPLTSLNPTFTVASQIRHAQRAHGYGDDDRERHREAIAMLDRVGIPDPEEAIGAYPHQFSGGMRQRITIATALLLRPRLLIADEATSALDVTLQAQILALLCGLCEEHGTSIIVISHDLGVIAEVCDRVTVLKDGEQVETGSVHQVLQDPQADYTRQLLAAVPSRHRRGERLRTPEEDEQPGAAPQQTAASRVADEVLLEVSDLRVHFPDARGLVDWLARRPAPRVHAVDGVDLQLRRGEAVGLVGESGSGKTTLGKALLGLIPTTAGTVTFDGQRLDGLSNRDWRPLRPRIQMIFQETYGSLSPRLRVSSLLTEPYRINSIPPEDQYGVDELLEMVRLSPDQATKHPHELSGGQARRVGIARAVAVQPELIVADEPTAGLDVSAAAGILNLIRDLRRDLGLSLLMITHDLNLVGYAADRIAVMYLGHIVEIGTSDQIFDSPGHPYTQALLAAIPEPVPDADTAVEQRVGGEVPSARTPPSGCRFRTRCAFAEDRCVEEVPALYPGAPDHAIACHFWQQIAAGEKPRTGPRHDPDIAT
jgi:oligopeptide/dipeptide ABC transporter ATP-binding protein